MLQRIDNSIRPLQNRIIRAMGTPRTYSNINQEELFGKVRSIYTCLIMLTEIPRVYADVYLQELGKFKTSSTEVNETRRSREFLTKSIGGNGIFVNKTLNNNNM
ncbi:hypothetical protein AB6A40_002000 [Gnathostoma spinigerum]|uniref:Uncharacterized protein n=1 Tax=Gnathostoma spinigerum TaxID=75299 RepID=A0ABD6E6S1_9BILA